jgi:hypothetical protein
MEPGEALGTAAQLALALAGFAGVVVAFRSSAVHEWEPIDRFRLRLLLNNSILPLTLCAIAMLLLSVKPQLSWIWRACSGLAIIFALPFAVITRRAGRAFSSEHFNLAGMSKFLFYLFGILGVAAILLQIYNVTALNAFWAFFATIIIQLLAGVFQFIRLILLRPTGMGNEDNP